jgi:hypothetical protein
MADKLRLPIFPTGSLYLPGTVALPSPFPTLGKVWLPPKDFAHLPGLPEKTVLVAIQAMVRPHTTIIRYVRAEFIAAMFVPEKEYAAGDSVVDWEEGKWHYAPDVHDLLAKPRHAIVYLPESAPVMTQSVFGATAAESAEHLADLWGCDLLHTVPRMRSSEHRPSDVH